MTDGAPKKRWTRPKPPEEEQEKLRLRVRSLIRADTEKGAYDRWAERLGMSREHLSRWLNGKVSLPTRTMALVLARTQDDRPNVDVAEREDTLRSLAHKWIMAAHYLTGDDMVKATYSIGYNLARGVMYANDLGYLRDEGKTLQDLEMEDMMKNRR